MTPLEARLIEEKMQSWIDALGKAIKFADEQRTSLAWSEIGSVMESMRALRGGGE